MRAMYSQIAASDTRRLRPTLTDRNSPVAIRSNTMVRPMLSRSITASTGHNLLLRLSICSCNCILTSLSGSMRRAIRKFCATRIDYHGFPRTQERAYTLRVANDEDDGQRWAKELVKRAGKAIKDARKGRSAAWLSDRTAELGYRVSPTVIAKLDSGHRGSVLSVPELIVLAAALNTSPVALVYPGPYGQKIEILPGMLASEIDAAEWFSAMSIFYPLASDKHGLDSIDWRINVESLTDWRSLLNLHRARAEVMSRGDFDRDGEQIAFYDRAIRDLRQRLGIAEDA